MSLKTTTVARLESRGAVSRNDATWLDVLGDFPALRGDLPASWFESTKLAECRSETRCWCDSQAQLTPLDEPSPSGDIRPIPIQLTDISRHGIGFSHAEPLPYRMVQISFDSGAASTAILVVRLQWCRFRKPGICESGGQIQRVVTAMPVTRPAG